MSRQERNLASCCRPARVTSVLPPFSRTGLPSMRTRELWMTVSPVAAIPAERPPAGILPQGSMPTEILPWIFALPWVSIRTSLPVTRMTCTSGPASLANSSRCSLLSSPSPVQEGMLISLRPDFNYARRQPRLMPARAQRRAQQGSMMASDSTLEPDDGAASLYPRPTPDIRTRGDAHGQNGPRRRSPMGTWKQRSMGWICCR